MITSEQLDNLTRDYLINGWSDEELRLKAKQLNINVNDIITNAKIIEQTGNANLNDEDSLQTHLFYKARALNLFDVPYATNNEKLLFFKLKQSNPNYDKEIQILINNYYILSKIEKEFSLTIDKIFALFNNDPRGAATYLELFRRFIDKYDYVNIKIAAVFAYHICEAYDSKEILQCDIEQLYLLCFSLDLQDFYARDSIKDLVVSRSNYINFSSTKLKIIIDIKLQTACHITYYALSLDPTMSDEHFKTLVGALYVLNLIKSSTLAAYSIDMYIDKCIKNIDNYKYLDNSLLTYIDDDYIYKYCYHDDDFNIAMRALQIYDITRDVNSDFKLDWYIK